MAVKGKRRIFVDDCTIPAQEGIATAAVRPGSLVDYSAAGITESASAATVFGKPPMFADYDWVKAKSVDDANPSGESMVARQLESGKLANVLVAVGNNITARNVALSSNGDGTLKIAATDGTEQVLCHSQEIINVTGSVALVLVRGA